VRGARAAIVTLAAALAAGCGLFARSVPMTHRYQVVGPAVTAEIPPDVKIELHTVSGAEPYQDTGIAYQTSPYRLDAFHFHRWVEAPTDLVTERLREVLYHPSNLGSEAPQAQPLHLDARIKAFQQVDEGAKPSGLVTIQFCLYPNVPYARALWCKTISKQNEADGPAPEQAAAAISLAFNEVMAEFASDLTHEIPAVAKASADGKAPATLGAPQ
jgi:ABC-type transport auxiliary lipoprotein component